MRYILPLIGAAVLIAAMFVFAAWMSDLERQWRLQRVTLPTISVQAIRLANFIHEYWYVLVAVILGCTASVALLWPRNRSSQ